MTCSMYFCPTCRAVPERYKSILRAAADDWYIYGLVITESETINCFFENAEKKAGMLIRPDMADNPDFCEAVRSFMNLKTEWPFRKDEVLAGYFFNDRKDWPDERIYDPGTVWTPVLKAFRSEISSIDELKNAVEILERSASNISRLCMYNYKL